MAHIRKVGTGTHQEGNVPFKPSETDVQDFGMTRENTVPYQGTFQKWLRGSRAHRRGHCPLPKALEAVSRSNVPHHRRHAPVGAALRLQPHLHQLHGVAGHCSQRPARGARLMWASYL